MPERVGEGDQPSQAVRAATIVTSEPGLVDMELPGWEPAEAGVFGVSDPVLDAGVGTVAGFQEAAAQ